MTRLPVAKTYKLFINGQFPRTESGRYYALKNKNKEVIANMCLASRKDFRSAVVAARSAFFGWSTRAALNRGQIVYRIAEMLEGRKAQFRDELILQGITPKAADAEINLGIDRLIYYAGWCDKYQQVFSAVNPVASPHFNFSVPEPSGVVAMVAPQTSGLLGLISVLTPVVAGGNTCVILASEKMPLSAITFSEVLSTSDLPPGVVNVLTGNVAELLPHFSSHMDVNALVYCDTDKEEIKIAQQNCATNVKRFFQWNTNWLKEESQNPYFIMDVQEIKTTWHPIDSGASGGGKY